MKFDEFKASVTLLDKEQRNFLRNKYIMTFIDVNSEWYHEWIEKRKRYCDGDCYLGYLWDCLKAKDLIDKAYIEHLHGQLGQVFVFWDIHSCERIFIKDYWKFDKDAMLFVDFDVLLQGTKYLPEDIYIFDQTFKWTLILTHEDIDGIPYYLKSGVL